MALQLKTSGIRFAVIDCKNKKKTMYKIFVLVILLVCSASLFAQGNRGNKIEVDEDGNLIVTPEMEEEIKKREQIVRHLNLYVTFSSIAKLNGVTQTANIIRVEKSQLKNLKFEFSFTNITAAPFSLNFSNSGFSLRTELKLNGREVKYSRDKSKLLKDKEDFPQASKIMKVEFAPGEKTMIPSFVNIGNLQDWYDPLETGFYQLFIHYHFHGQKKLSTSPIFLEILPDTP